MSVRDVICLLITAERCCLRCPSGIAFLGTAMARFACLARVDRFFHSACYAVLVCSVYCCVAFFCGCRCRRGFAPQCTLRPYQLASTCSPIASVMHFKLLYVNWLAKSGLFALCPFSRKRRINIVVCVWFYERAPSIRLVP